MRPWLARFSAVVLVVWLASGNVALCAGWLPTADARMACCVDGTCPMHASPKRAGSPDRPVTQAEADRCCAASEPTDLAPAVPAATALDGSVITVGPSVLVATLAIETAHAASPPRPPLPLPHISRHLLLSVLLV
jgi:hypothetical protein